MKKLRDNTVVCFLVKIIATACSFILVDYIWYGLIHPVPGPYSQVILSHLGTNLILSVAFTTIYNIASNNWASTFHVSSNSWASNGGILIFPNKHAYGTWGSWGIRVLNGVIFSLLIWVVMCCAVALMDVIISTVYIHFLDGIRGAVPHTDEHTDAVVAAELALAAIAMESIGKTEQKPPRA